MHPSFCFVPNFDLLCIVEFFLKCCVAVPKKYCFMISFVFFFFLIDINVRAKVARAASGDNIVSVVAVDVAVIADVNIQFILMLMKQSLLIFFSNACFQKTFFVSQP